MYIQMCLDLILVLLTSQHWALFVAESVIDLQVVAGSYHIDRDMYSSESLYNKSAYHLYWTDFLDENKLFLGFFFNFFVTKIQHLWNSFLLFPQRNKYSIIQVNFYKCGTTITPGVELCGDIICQNGGTCRIGASFQPVCDCPLYFTGTRCNKGEKTITEFKNYLLNYFMMISNGLLLCLLFFLRHLCFFHWLWYKI